MASVSAQNIYPEKYEGCNTERFALESDSIYAFKNNDELIDILTKCIDRSTLKKLRGVLRFQVIAYEDNSSCAMSYENNTNKSASDLNLDKAKSIIDNELVWDRVDEAASPMIELNFKKKGITLTRYGLNGKRGLHIVN